MWCLKNVHDATELILIISLGVKTNLLHQQIFANFHQDSAEISINEELFY